MDNEQLIIQNETMTGWLDVKYIANHAMDLYENLKSMYVYFNVLDQRVVGSNILTFLIGGSLYLPSRG